MSSPQYQYFANAPRGLGQLLNKELRHLGAEQVSGGEGGVSFAGPLETGYRACLWSRFANNVLLRLAEFEAADQQAVYEQVKAFPWEDHLDADGTLAVRVTGKGAGLDHSRFAEQRVKDAIVDRFQESVGHRPSVDLEQPDIRVHCHLFRSQVQLSLDLSGVSLHRRGYRDDKGIAPLKENLAAGMLQLAEWRTVARAGGPLVDPMCGSGTLLIEAAWMAADVAPGLYRDYFGFLRWRQHDAELWTELKTEAHARRTQGLKTLPPVIGYDQDKSLVKAARYNARRAALGDYIKINQVALSECPAPEGDKLGLLITNPPYGVRLGDDAQLLGLYADLGRVLRARFQGWRAATISPRQDLVSQMGLPIVAEHQLFNGAIEAPLFRFKVPEAGAATQTGEAARAFANRLRKNQKHLGKWLQREGIECYRLYDADLPDFNFAVDVYGQHAHVQEYAPPRQIDPVLAAARRGDALAVIAQVLELAPAQVHFKVRERQRGSAQYNKVAASEREFEVREDGLRFLVNLDDYLDTGLFLDHRGTRARVGEQAWGKRFLNLFAYTGSFSVYAAQGRAVSTTTIDMSRTYLDWAKRNMALNGFDDDARHRFIRADCLEWLEEATQEFDLIVLDPPSFSNSARMEGTLDIQRDHANLIELCMARLGSTGLLVFSNNLRGFRLDPELAETYRVQDIGRATLPMDFARRPNIHHCWEIRHADDEG